MPPIGGAARPGRLVSALPRGLRALRHRDFRVYYAAGTVGLVGGWMQSVAQAWLVLQLTNSPFRLGLVTMCHFLPMLFLAVVGGAAADRLPKRRLIATTQSALAAQALLLALLVGTDAVRYWHVVVLALVWGTVNAVDTPARQALVAEMVGREDIVNAVALHAAAFNAARVVGPATAGVLIAAVGLTPAFVINGFTAAVVAMALLRLRAGGTAAGRAGPSLRQEIAEGLRYAVRTPVVRLVLGVLFVVTLTVFNFAVYIPLLARDVLHAGPEGYGFLMASLGIGAVAGALALGASRGGHPPPVVLLGSAAVSCAVLLLLAGVGRFASAAAALVVLGFASIITVAGANTTLQLTAPDHLRARVLSLHMLVFGGVFPLGAFLIGSLSEARGVRIAFLAAGGVGLTALGAISGWWALRGGSRPAGSAPP